MRYGSRQSAARQRAQQRRLRGIQAGTGRISVALGAKDPRHRRNDQSAQATDQRFTEDFVIDKNGRLGLKGGD